MLRIDCLIKNTELAHTVKQIIGHLGYKAISEDKNAPFREMYNTLIKNGVEIDLESAAHIYANELPLHDPRFTPAEDLRFETGRWFDEVTRAITLQKPKIGEKKIGELSPSQAVVKGIASAFASNVKADLTTKTILKTLEDFYAKASKRSLGELPNEKGQKETRSAAEIVQQALDRELLGYRDVVKGTINGLAKLHEDVRRQIKELTQKMEATGDHDKIEQWNNYAKSLEDASYTLMFTSAEAKKVLHDALKDGGFVKVGKSGNEIVDWQKLAGHVNSYEQLRDNVISSLTGHGIDAASAGRVADSMTKEFRDIRGKILETADRKQQRLADTWTEAAEKVKESLPEIVAKRIQDWRNYTKFEGRQNAPLKFSKIEAQKIIGEALRNTEEYGMDFAADKRAIDWQKMAQDPPAADKLKRMVWEHLEKSGLSGAKADEVSNALIRDYHQTLLDKIEENSKRLLDNREAALDREMPNRKSALMRLGEMHDLGIFQGEHDRLLAHVLGIDPEDVQAIRGIKEYAEKLSTLRQLLSGNDFVVPSVVHSLNREIHSILAPVIANKTKAMKMVSAINKIYQVENSLLIATHGNILENHLSGALEMLTTNLSMRLKLGSELGGFKKQDRKLMADVHSHVRMGGVEAGLAPYQIGGTKERLSDKYTWHNMKGKDWSNPHTWAQAIATSILSVPRTFLGATDSMNKIGLMSGHMKGAVVDAMVASSGGDMSKDEAVRLYNDAIYGPGQLDIAKQKARDLYKSIGLKYVSEKELNITANELLRENLIRENLISAEDLKEVMDNTFHQAGLGMGHESNNWFSERQQSWKQALNRKEQVALSQNDYNKAMKIRMANTFLNDMVFRFAASRFNWAWIRAEQAGVGVLTGLYHYGVTNKKYKNTDILDTKKMNEAAVEYQKARQKLFRGAIGMGVNATGYLIAKGIASAMYPDQEDPMEAMFDEMKENWGAKALYLKVAPLWMLQSYEYNEAKYGDATDKNILALMNSYSNLTNIGDKNDFSNELAFAMNDLKNGKTEKARNKGYAMIGKMLNGYIPHIPLLKQGKNLTQFVNYVGGGEPAPMPPYPQNFLQGFLYGGIIQDVAGQIPAESLPESLQAWGKEEEK